MDRLREDFVFTSSNIQDYVDRPFRFHLKYVLGAAWPSTYMKQKEQFITNIMQRGKTFHMLIYQYSIGMPSEQLFLIAKQEGITRRWENYLKRGIQAVETEMQDLNVMQCYI